MNHLSIRDIFRTLFYCCFLSNSGKEVVNSINFPSRRKNRKADLVTCFESRTATPPLVSARVFRGIFCPIGDGSEGFKRSASPAAYRFFAKKNAVFGVKKAYNSVFYQNVGRFSAIRARRGIHGLAENQTLRAFRRARSIRFGHYAPRGNFRSRKRKIQFRFAAHFHNQVSDSASHSRERNSPKDNSAPSEEITGLFIS